MKKIKQILSSFLVMVMLLSSLSINMTANTTEAADINEEEIAVSEKVEEEVIDTELAEAPSTVTEKGMQFKIDNLEDVKTIRYAYGEYETEKDIKYGVDSVSHSAKILRKRGNSCTLQFPKAGLVSIVITYNDGSRDFYKYDVIKSSPTVTRDGGNNITFGNLTDIKVLRYVKGEYESSSDIKRASGSVAISGKTLNSNTYTVTLERETYTFCVQYNDESYNYYVTGVCGDNLTWVYDKQSATLTVSGEGEMYEYNYETIPWVGYKSEIRNVILNDGITDLSAASFSYCMIEVINLPSTLEKIGEEAFFDCDSLETIIIPDNVTYIEAFAFYECDSLETIIIPDNVTYLGALAFYECDNLESVVIGEGISTIEISTFDRCPNLKKVVFGSNIKIIRDYAFIRCTSLNNIDLPDSVEEIGEYVFYGTGFYNNEDNWENGVLYCGKCLLAAKVSGTYIIKDGTKTIGYAAFENSYISVCYIPESVEHIGFGGLGNKNGEHSHFKVVEGSYAEQHIIETKKNYPHVGLTYSYFNPSDIYG